MDGATGALISRARCPACQSQDKAVANMFTAILERGSLTKMLAALEGSDGLCFTHLRQVLGKVRDEATGAHLIQMHLEKLERIEADLAEIIRKSDYRHADELPGPEAGAWQRALRMVTGRKAG